MVAQNLGKHAYILAHDQDIRHNSLTALKVKHVSVMAYVPALKCHAK